MTNIGMSAIDQHKHKCLGIVQCLFDFEKTIALAYENIPIYEIDQGYARLRN